MCRGCKGGSTWATLQNPGVAGDCLQFCVWCIAMTTAKVSTDDEDNLYYWCCIWWWWERELRRPDPPTRCMDGSSQGSRMSNSQSCSSSSESPTRYKQSLQAPPPDRPGARVVQLKSYSIHSVLWQYRATGLGHCHPRVGGGGLLKAAQEDSWSKTHVHWPVHHTWGTPWWSLYTQEPSVLCISEYIYSSPPPVCQCNRGVLPPPPPCWERRRGATSQDGPELAPKSLRYYPSENIRVPSHTSADLIHVYKSECVLPLPGGNRLQRQEIV